MKKLIAITGMPGAGKSVMANVAKKMGLTVISMGDVVREEAASRGIPPTPENLGRIMIELREKHGPNIVAKKCAEKIKECHSEIIVIDGVRSLFEVEEFRKISRNIVIVAIHASPRTRFKRLKSRGRSDDPQSWAEFNERDLRELRVGIGEVIALADYMIVNEGTLEEFKNEARKLLRRLLSNGSNS